METAEGLVRDEFERYYSALPVSDDEDDIEIVDAHPVRSDSYPPLVLY